MAMTGIPWLLQKLLRTSGKNGEIRVTQSLGQWSVVVDGCEQTTPYTNAMWADALARIQPRPGQSVRRILMLGLAAGGALKILYERFPGCGIVAVDHDPEMIRIAQELALYAPYPEPQFVQADAADAVSALTQQFDLILVDLFTGEEPPHLIVQDAFMTALARRLAPDGLLVANVYKRTEYLETLGAGYHSRQQWTYRYNSLGLFSKPKI